MPVSKAQQKAVNKYMNAHYDRINLIIPKGRKETIEQYAQQAGKSVNSYLNHLICTGLSLTETEWKAREENAE